MDIATLNWNMSLAYDQAEIAYQNYEVPVGAIIVDSSGRVLATACNNKEKTYDPTGHAELIAIRAAAKELSNWRLLGCTVFVTLEPCPMCLSAMMHARVERLVFGAYDPKGGALGLGFNMYKDKRLNHCFDVVGGILHYKCSKIMSDFFKGRR